MLEDVLEGEVERLCREVTKLRERASGSDVCGRVLKLRERASRSDVCG